MKMGRMTIMKPCMMVAHWPMTLAKEPKSVKLRPGVPAVTASFTSGARNLRPMRMGVPTAPKETQNELKTRQMTAAASGGEAQREQQRRSEGCWRTEARGTFDEGGEHVADDDGLDALVTADVLHPVLDGLHAAAVLQRVQDDDGAEDDDQNADGGDDALQGKGGHIAGGQVPDADGAENADEP